MTYVIYQKIKGYLYAYEVTAKWDPVKKNSRQKRKYLGKVDENGNIIPKGLHTKPSKIEGAYDFGDVFLVLHAARDLKLDSMLRGIFHEEGEKILIIAASRIIMPGSMRLVGPWLSRTCLDQDIPSQRISEILSMAGKKAGEFTTQWLKSSQKEEAIYFDITSMESYSAGNRFLEYGYSRSDRDEPQVNLGLIMGKSMRPLFYDVYPGSIPDVKTLLNILAMLKRFGITAVILVLDRGFYAIYNIRELIKFSFIMPLPFRTTAARDILKACRKVRTENARMYNHSLIYVESGSFHLDGISLNYTFYYDQEREMIRKRKFFEKLTKVEDDLAKITDMTKVEETAGSFMKYLRIQPGMIITRKNRAISRRLNTMGRTILISNAKLAWDEALDLYRSRDRVEKGFRDMKSDLGSLPMGVHSDETMQGYLLIQFISLIVESDIRRRMRKSRIHERMSLHEMLIELSKLRVVKQDGAKFLTEISKRQREIFEAMEIEEKDLVIN